MADRISITICGDGGSGKSSITLRLVRSQWTHEYDPTIEDSYSVTRTVDGISYRLSLTDTAGQEEYRSLWASSNLDSDAFLLIYDLTNAQSLDALDYFMQMIDIETEHRIEENSRLLKGDGGRLGDDTRALMKALPVKIVAGNKCDLKGERALSARVGLEWARSRGCGFMETSAREMVNIEETFALIVRRVVEARQTQSKRPKTTPYRSNPSRRSNSIMNLTKENSLESVGQSKQDSPYHSGPRTPALEPSTTGEEKESAPKMPEKEPIGVSTRLDGRPDLGRGSIITRRLRISLQWLRCWRRRR